MTTEEILQEFSDINHAYNNSSKYDTLKRMLDELIESILDKIKMDVFNDCCDNYHMPVFKLDCDEIIEIIDKYKAESEEE